MFQKLTPCGRLSDAHRSAQCVVFPAMVHGLVQAAIQVVNLEAVHVTHGASLAQPHALLLRCDGGTVPALAATHSNTTVIMVGGTNLLEEILTFVTGVQDCTVAWHVRSVCNTSVSYNLKLSWRLIIVPSRGWKSLNIWEQL